jgi:cytochrome c biogenesis protein CcmG/thiol:disulfide interchange protein DsbE
MRSLAALLLLGVSAFAAAPPVIKKAPDFTFTEPNGTKIQLSNSKGNVVVLSFIYTTCSHCQDECRMLNKLYKEMGPRGLQVMAAAFNDNAAVLVGNFVEQFGISFPVGYATPETVLNYQGFSVMDRYSVPQVVVIDRKGNIRAQSPVAGDPNLQTESYMRNLIETLLREPGPAPAAKKPSVH